MTGDVELLSSLQHAWGSLLGDVTSCERLSERNFVYRMHTPACDYILKEAGLVNPQGDVDRKLAADIAVLRHLKAHGVPVALPEPTDDGQPYLHYEGRCFTLAVSLPSEPGENVPLDRLYRNIGTAIAQLHRALASYPGPIYSWTMDLPPRILDEAVPVIMRHQDAAQNEKLTAVLGAIRQPLTERLTGLPSQHIHGDCHTGNVLRVGEEVSGFIDLDHLPFGPRIYDLSYYLFMTALNDYQKPAGAEIWFNTVIPNLLTGYQQEIQLTSAEKEAVPYMMLGILLILCGWLFEPLNIPEWAHGDMLLFHWIYANIDKVRAP